MNNLEIDFHVHSKYSFDSFLSPKKIVEIAKRRRLKGIAIVDHNSINGSLEAKKYATDDFFVINGSEINTDQGDIIGIFLNEKIRSRDVFIVIDEIQKQGGLAILPHFFRLKNSKHISEISRKIDVIEGFNSRTSLDFNLEAQEFAKKNKIPITSGSDAHFYGEIGNARTILKNIYNEDDIRKSIINHKILNKGTTSKLYYQGGSRIIADIKSGKLYKLPHTLINLSIKGILKRNDK